MSRFLIHAAWLFAVSAVSLVHAADAPAPELAKRGRYVVMLGGCNDCHTNGFGPSGGKMPESQWLTGSALGFNGAWGTTYPSNLRLRIGSMDLPAWKSYARSLTSRPPMPYWALNEMSDGDLEALWTFVRSLGPAGEPAPSALPPEQQPAGPVVRFPMPPRESASKH